MTEVRDAHPAEVRGLAIDGALLLDVREPEEWAAGHVAGSRHLPLGELDEDHVARIVADRPTGVPIVVICRSGNRSGQAAGRLAGAGGSGVVNLAGGLTAWAAAGFPLVTDDGSAGSIG